MYHRRVGTVAGRHSLPVDGEYLLAEAKPGQQAYEDAYNAACAYGAMWRDVELYYTGLTEVTLGAIDGFDAVGCRVRLMRFNADTGEYSPLQRFRGALKEEIRTTLYIE